MIPSVAKFARLASTAHEERAGFESTQIIESNGLRVEAIVRRIGTRSIHVEYKTYQSSWAELEEVLSGQIEFVEDELCGSTLNCESNVTWIYDPSTDTAIRKIGSQLFEPIPGLATLGELSFLGTLTQDFLLRDLGEEAIDNRVIRRIALKPKQAYRSQLLSSVTFSIRTATIDFDSETFFPVHISLVPSSGSPAASILGPNAMIRISYKDVVILKNTDSANPFSPPSSARVFEESRTSVEDLADLLPFSAPLAALSNHRFEADGKAVLLSIDTENKRAYATSHFSSANATAQEDAPAPRLTLTFGNYVSRNMARRRTVFSELGKPASEGSLPLQFLDRREIWKQRFPGIDAQYAPVDAFFEKDSVFWFLSGTGMELDSMEALARDLFETEGEAE